MVPPEPAKDVVANDRHHSTVFHPTEWSKAVKMTVAGLATIGGIIGMFIGVESWTDEKIESKVTESEKRQIEQNARLQVTNEINHDKMIQSQRLSEAEIQIKLIELEMKNLEDEIDRRRSEGLNQTVRQERTLARLIESMRIWESQHEDAQEKLTRVARSGEPNE